MLLKKLDHPTDIDIYDLAAKKNFVALKAGVDKLGWEFINWLMFQPVWIIKKQREMI